MENAMSLLLAYTEVCQRIVQAALNARRKPGSLHLIAVSKTFPAGDIRELYGLGQRDFGENWPIVPIFAGTSSGRFSRTKAVMLPNARTGCTRWTMQNSRAA